jgi:hypothetical protein
MPTETPALHHEAIPFAGALTREQFSLVQRLLLPWWGSMWITSLFIFVLALMFNLAGEAGATLLVNTLANLLWAAAMSVFVWVMTSLVRYRQWRRIKAMKQTVAGRIGETGIEWNTPMTTATFPWPKIVKLRQHPDMLLFFYSARCAFYVPRTFFATETAWRDANELALRSFSARSRRGAQPT